MGDTSKYKEEKQIALGILAHVDAGKTTLSESMLHKGGIVDNIGRVDKKNAFLDNYELEKERGITIFSKQAVFRIGNMRVTLLDTPGHIDFSAEMERTLQVLDYAVLVINGADGVQGHTRTLWRLLERYQIPVFLFINKMDQFKGNDEEKQEEQERLLASLQKELSTSCLDFGGEWDAAFLENLALCEEEVLEHYLTGDEICRRFHVCKRTLQTLRDTKAIPYTTLGGKILYPESGIFEVLKKNYRDFRPWNM